LSHCLTAFDVIVIGSMIADIFPMKSSAGLLFVSLLLFTACSSPTDNLRPIPIAGGKVVGIAFGPQGPMPGKGNGYEVQYAASVPGTTKTELIYKFAFTAPPSTTLKRVVVDDISDEQSAPGLIDEQKPWLDGNLWKGETKPYDIKDPLLAWAYTVTPSMRVYRFTITDSTGAQTILYQLTGYPQFMKAAMRFSWGEKY
jgi:hypothetical protein